MHLYSMNICNFRTPYQASRMDLAQTANKGGISSFFV